MRRDRWAAILLVAYVIAVALIAFWPTPVDAGAGGFLREVTRAIPWATYGRIEFAANVVFFVPLGLLLSILLYRRRSIVLPIGIVATVTIELLQGQLLEQRTASLLDVIANILGTCVGMILAVLFDRRRDGEAAPAT